MHFTKMQGIGNDYIFVNCLEETVANPEEVARKISHRHFGVGSDGLILIEPSDEADVKMVMYNADGSKAEMCGNGIRCVAKYVYDRGISKANPMKIETGGGVLTLNLTIENDAVSLVKVNMGEPKLKPDQIPVNLPGDKIVNEDIRVGNKIFKMTCVSMGNPHCVIFIDEDPMHLDLNRYGPFIENKIDLFPNRVNVEFVQRLRPSLLVQRTWERGTGETFACGTGACAVCVAGVLTDMSKRSVTVNLQGGSLEIEWNEKDNCVYQTGPAVEVFSGEWQPEMAKNA